MSMIWGRNAASNGSSAWIESPELDDSRFTVSGPSASPSRAGSTGWLPPVDDPRVDDVAEPGGTKLAHEGVQAAFVLETGDEAADRCHRVGRPGARRPAGSAGRSMACSFGGRPSPGPPSYAASVAGGLGRRQVARVGGRRRVGSVQSQVRRRLSSRRPVRSRWIGVTAMRRLITAWKSVPSTARPGRRRAADPEVGDPARDRRAG